MRQKKMKFKFLSTYQLNISARNFANIFQSYASASQVLQEKARSTAD